VLALMLLGAQVLWLSFDRWAATPSLRPIYASICAFAGCEMPPLQSLEALRIEHVTVRSDPQRASALSVDLLLINGASYAQAFPVLAVYTAASGDRETLVRRFLPQDYLQGELTNALVIPANTPVHVALLVDVRGAVMNSVTVRAESVY